MTATKDISSSATDVKPSYTSGPWEARSYRTGRTPPHGNAQPESIWIDCKAYHRGRALGGTIAEVYARGTGSSDPHVQQANARLIAAAPCQNLALEKAEHFIAGFEGDELQEGVDELLSEIRAALARARAP